MQIPRFHFTEHDGHIEIRDRSVQTGPGFEDDDVVLTCVADFANPHSAQAVCDALNLQQAAFEIYRGRLEVAHYERPVATA